jgi:hypothetical protein
MTPVIAVISVKFRLASGRGSVTIPEGVHLTQRKAIRGFPQGGVPNAMEMLKCPKRRLEKCQIFLPDR